MGKSLMTVFCKLMSHNPNVQYRDAASYFLRLAATQAQGYAALAKARQVIGLPEKDYASLLHSRLVSQAAAVSDALEVGYGITQWNDALHREGWGEMAHPYGDPTPATEPYYFLPDNPVHVMVGMSFVADPGPPSNVGTDTYFGKPIAKTRNVDPASLKTIQGGVPTGIINQFMTTYEQDPETGIEYAFFRHHAQEFVLDPKYIIVGIRVSNVDTVTMFEPLVAEYDEEKGTTSWDGKSGGIWKATLDETCQPTVVNLGPREANWSYREKFWSSFPKGPYKMPDPTTMTGFRLNRRFSGDKMWIMPGFLNPYWAQATGLPAATPSPYLRYEPVELL
jgi:hypothetical protein